ncbi:hypothetical protein [Zoogloea sp.]|uniref:hypothetical protein n=1 Tax=Zoogloea sp. TaxID=49181 RepID=UPI00262622A0|nr:hypothetical protein [Zoogloea sp.]
MCPLCSLSEGCNVLVGTDTAHILEKGGTVLAGQSKHGHCPALWNGKAMEHIGAKSDRLHTL